ncbi:MAG TPA: alanine-zipper protein [Stellaceae bacterium]|nr:alanine-zipper protein [Stellaceae bacterium]
MQAWKRLLVVLVPVLFMGACTTLSDQDRALIASANQNAADAKAMAQQALTAAQAAQASSANAAQSASKAAADAQAANEKADRMFQRTLRK